MSSNIKDFSGLSLRGRNFKRQDLTGANFSNADIRGANFSDAILIGANFRGVTTGLSNSGIVIQSIILIGLLFVYFYLSTTACFSIGAFVSFGRSGNNTFLALFMLVFTFFAVVIWRGFLIGILALTILSTFLSLITVSTPISSIGSSAIFIMLSLLSSVTLASVIGIFVGRKFVVLVVLLAIVSAVDSVRIYIDERSNPETFVIPPTIEGITITIILSLLGVYVALRALDEDKKHVFIRSLAINLSTFMGSTNFSAANLTDANFTAATFKNTRFIGANLTRTRWHGAKNLNLVLTKDNYLNNPKLRKYLVGMDLRMNESYIFDKENLKGVNFQGKDLVEVSFIGTDLRETNLREANLRGANLTQALLDNADLTGAVLTGVCIEDWKINAQTVLDNVECKYVFQRFTEFSEGHKRFSIRLPKNTKSVFKPGEFEALVRRQQDTIDLIFVDGIDWQVFFQSFQQLREQYQDSDITIQSIERKGEDFVIRLETTADILVQGEIEASVRENYESRLSVLNEQVEFYKSELSVKRDEQLRANARFDNIVEMLATMTDNKGSTYQTTIHANYLNAISTGSGNIQNATQNIGANLDEITKLIQSLKTNAQAFPEDQKIDIEITIEDLESDLANEAKMKPSRLAKRLLALWGSVCLISAGIAGAADFSNNVLELSEKLEVPFSTEIIQQNPHIPHALPGE